MTIAALLIVPLYVAPVFLRSTLLPAFGYAGAAIVADILGSLAVGFLNNDYLLSCSLYAASTALELLLMYAGHRPHVAMWAGDLIPALVAIHFAQKLYLNMGD